MTTVKRFTTDATALPPQTAHLPIKPKDDTPKETITWKGKTYSIKVMKNGQTYYPKTPQEWTAIKTAHIALLDAVNNLNSFQGATSINISNSFELLTFVREGKMNVINLEETFNNPSVAADVKAAYRANKDASPSPIIMDLTNADVLANNPEVRKARLASQTEMLTEEDLGQFLEKLKTNRKEGNLDFDYRIARPETVQPGGQLQKLKFEFASDMYEALTQRDNFDDLIFAMPYLENGHFKLVLVDFLSKVVYHYDPRGAQISNERLFELSQIAQMLEHRTGKKFISFLEQENTHQTDGTSSGHFVLDSVKSIVEYNDPGEYMNRKFNQRELPDLKHNLAEYYAPSSGTTHTESALQPEVSLKARLGSKTEMLSQEDINEFLAKLQRNRKEGDLDFDYTIPIPETVHPGGQLQKLKFEFASDMYEALTQRDNFDDLIFAMPYLENGHFKLVLVDFLSKVVYHYDPRGAQISNERLFELYEIAQMLEYKTGKEFILFLEQENTHQTDGTSSGHFVLDSVKSIVEYNDPGEYMNRKFNQRELPDLKHNLAEYYAPSSGTRHAASALQPEVSLDSEGTDDDDSEEFFLVANELPAET